jgi:hypothetical protein
MRAAEVAQLVAEAVRMEVIPLKEEINSLREKLEQSGRAIKTISDIAREYGYSRATIERTPWLMPNWGRSDLPGKRKRWLRETYQIWFATSISVRERQWHTLPIKEKDRINSEVKR